MSISRVPLRNRSFRGAVCMLFPALSLAGCSTLPSSGPTGVEIRQASDGKNGQYPFTLVEVAEAAALPGAPATPASGLTTLPPRPTDLLGPGTSSTSAFTKPGFRCSAPRLERQPRPEARGSIPVRARNDCRRCGSTTMAISRYRLSGGCARRAIRLPSFKP